MSHRQGGMHRPGDPWDAAWCYARRCKFKAQGKGHLFCREHDALVPVDLRLAFVNADNAEHALYYVLIHATPRTSAPQWKWDAVRALGVETMRHRHALRDAISPLRTPR